MVYVASVVLEGKATVGKGNTEEEAIEHCLAQVRRSIYLGVELAKKVVLPPAIVAKVPTALPDGYGLLILERCSHNDGTSYDWRFFAVKRGTHALRKKQWCDDAKPKEYTIGTAPFMYSFLDCNADYDFLLPKGSLEFVDEGWESCEVAHYDY